MKYRPDIAGLLGLALSAAFAVIQKWSLPEFCWSIWLSGLSYSWACVVSGAVHIILTARADKPHYEERLPALSAVPEFLFLPGITLAAVAAGFVAAYLYVWLFGFYGIFLSVFAEMAPLDLFGRNGFINSDFFTPLAYLAGEFWPMALGVLIADAAAFFGKNPWRRMLLPFRMEVVRIHVFIVALPFLSLLAWALFDAAWQPAAIVLLMGIFYLMPKPGEGRENVSQNEYPNCT